MSEVQCPACRGHGEHAVLFPIFAANATAEDKANAPRSLPCELCEGKKRISPAMLARYEKGRERKKQRLDAGYGLRQYAEMIGIKPSDLSRLERGLLVPEDS